MIIKLIYLGQCHVNQRDLKDLLAAGKYLKIDGFMEDIDVKVVDESLVRNKTEESNQEKENKSEHINIDTDVTVSEIGTEKEIIAIQPNHKLKDRHFNCNKCIAVFSSQ